MHSGSFHLPLRLAPRSIYAFEALTLPTSDADLLSAPPPTLTRLTLLANTHPFMFFDSILNARPEIVHLVLPNFVGVPHGAGVASRELFCISLHLTLARPPDAVFRAHSTMACVR
jgi:hypothetical protein